MHEVAYNTGLILRKVLKNRYFCKSTNHYFFKMSENSDIKENVIYNEDPKLLELLLIDRTKTTNEDVHNIMWATDNYAPMGQGYQEWDESATGKMFIS